MEKQLLVVNQIDNKQKKDKESLKADENEQIDS